LPTTPVGIVVPDPAAVVVNVDDADTVADLLDAAIAAEHASGKVMKPIRRASRGRQPAAHGQAPRFPPRGPPRRGSS
jgi:hypothetical protein